MSIIYKEHLIRGSDPSLWGFAGLDTYENESHNVRSRVWEAMSSKLLNIAIVLAVIMEAIVIACQLLIDANWLHDPNTLPLFCHIANSTANSTATAASLISPKLFAARIWLARVSLIITSVFFVEVFLRICSGGLRLLAQPCELLDALLVNVVFVLNVIFFSLSSSDIGTQTARNGGQEATLLVIVLRLWRVHRIIQLIVEESQQNLLLMLNVCEKDKTHAEHKVDILILKVEDLEHEVAYLKEKLKKTERDNEAYIQQLMNSKSSKRLMSAKRTQSANSTQSYCPCGSDSNAKRLMAITQMNGEHRQQNHSNESQTSQPIQAVGEPNKVDCKLDVFARDLAQSITTDAMSTLEVQNSVDHHNVDHYWFPNASCGELSHSNNVYRLCAQPNGVPIERPLYSHASPHIYLESIFPVQVNNPFNIHNANPMMAARVTSVEFCGSNANIPLTSL